MSGHSLKLHFCMFERSQVKHNSLDCHNFVWNIFHYLQSLHSQSLTQIINMFACLKHSNLESGQSLFFFSNVLFSIKCASFLLKFVKDFNIDHYKGKRTWTDENCFYNRFEHIWLKIAFDPNNYGFWKCAFNQSCSCLYDKGNECIIYMI